MKHKKTLLIILFLTFFVFQQAQADGVMPSTTNPSPGHFVPAYAPYSQIHVFVLYLDTDTNAIYQGIPRKCVAPNEFHGCGIIDPEHPDAPQNPATVTVDPYYLRDVITIEMNVGEIPPTSQELPALKAQAVAARTVASWKAANQYYMLGSEGGIGYINNSTQYQVFIPGSYNNFPAAQSLIDTAISETQGQYLSYFPDGTAGDGTRKTIDAEFGSDFKGQSVDEPSKDYLNVIQDPISTTCDVPATPIYSGWGMSQKGALRWSKGNQCANQLDRNQHNGGGQLAWPVRWTDYRQILAHYYTGIDFLNDSAAKIAPDDRWNLLDYRLEDGSDVPSEMTLGQEYRIKLRIQNTSTTDWSAGEITLGLTLRPACRRPTSFDPAICPCNR